MLLPVLPVPDVNAAMDFYTGTLGFSEMFRMPDDSGNVQNGRIVWGDVQFLFNLNPEAATGGPVWYWINIEGMDVDAYYEELKAKGLEIVEEIGDRFWGDRSFAVKDPNGYVLSFMQPVKAQA